MEVENSELRSMDNLPSSDSNPTNTYINNLFGFSFIPPSGWEMEESPQHPNGRCFLIKISLFDLPDQIPFVIGGRYLTNTEILQIPLPPTKVLFWSN